MTNRLTEEMRLYTKQEVKEHFAASVRSDTRSPPEGGTVEGVGTEIPSAVDAIPRKKSYL